MMRSYERGFALLVVFWMLAPLSLVVTGLIASGRGEVKLVENLRSAAIAEAAADGAAYEALFHLVSGQWSPGPGVHRLQIGDFAVVVRIDDESGKVNPNDAPRDLMIALLRNVGANR